MTQAVYSLVALAFIFTVITPVVWTLHLLRFDTAMKHVRSRALHAVEPHSQALARYFGAST